LQAPIVCSVRRHLSLPIVIGRQNLEMRLRIELSLSQTSKIALKKVFESASALAFVALFAACARNEEPPPRQPQQAGQPLDPVRVAAQIASARAAATLGDEQAAAAEFAELAEDFRKSIKLADTARAVDREAARVAAKRVNGVRSAVWIDHQNLFAIVTRDALRSQTTIDAICLELEPLGDTLGVVVNLQSAAATTGDALEILSRNCQLPPGERALMQRERMVDVIPPEVRAQHRAQNEAGVAQATQHEHRQRESMEILERTTPEL
jgi:hypothetical protein